jgi:L-ribulose-5-phosphate 3-epimerase
MTNLSLPSRRQLLQQAALAGIGLVGTGSLRAAQTFPPRKRAIRMALKYGMIAEGKTALEKFRIAKEAGFEGVEPGGPFKAGEMEELKAAMAETGLVIPGTVCPQGGRKSGSLDEAERKEGVKLFAESLRQTKELGGTTVLMYPGIVDETRRYADVYAALLKSCRELVPVAEETGVKIALENVWNNLFLSPLDAVRFVDEIGSPSLGWFFDIGNVARYGWPEHWVRALGKRIFKLDIKDYSTEKHMKEGPRAGFDVELGDGDINHAAVFKAVDEIGYDGGWISAEVKGGDLAKLTDIAKRLDRLLRL